MCVRVRRAEPEVSQKWLKPGGKLLISDYCRGAQEPSELFKSYVSQRRYFLHTVAEYGTVRSCPTLSPAP